MSHEQGDHLNANDGPPTLSMLAIDLLRQLLLEKSAERSLAFSVPDGECEQPFRQLVDWLENEELLFVADQQIQLSAKGHMVLTGACISSESVSVVFQEEPIAIEADEADNIMVSILRWKFDLEDGVR